MLLQLNPFEDIFRVFPPLYSKGWLFLYVRSMQVMSALLGGLPSAMPKPGGWGKSRTEHTQNAEKN